MYKKIIIITAILLLSGCSSVQKNSNLSINDDSCSTKHKGESNNIYYSIYGSCYWENNTPIDLLNDLKSHPNDELRIHEAPKDWIKKEHIFKLMELIDSNEPAAPVLSFASSYGAFDKISTIGNEAMFLIEGYRKKVYPPEHCSFPYGENDQFGYKADKQELKEWWKSATNQEIVNENEKNTLSKNTKIYENFKEGIRVTYPSDWIVKEVNYYGLLAIISPPEEKPETASSTALSIVVTEEAKGLTLEEFSASRVAQMREQIIVRSGGEVEFSEVTLGEKSAHQVILTWLDHKSKVVWTIYNDKEYTLTCKYCENYEQVGGEMINSFEFIQ